MFPDAFCLNTNGLSRWGRAVNCDVSAKIRHGDIKTIINCAVSYDIGDLDVLNAANYELPSKFLELAMQGEAQFITFGSFFENYVGEYKRPYIESKLRFRDSFLKTDYDKSFYLTLQHVYGRFDNPKKFIPQVIEKIKKGDQIFLDDPDTLRDFTPVAFVERAISFILTSQNKMRIFDVGTTKQLSTIEFVKKLYRYRHFSCQNRQIPISVNSYGQKFDVIRASKATLIPEELRVSNAELHQIEQDTFRDLFS